MLAMEQSFGCSVEDDDVLDSLLLTQDLEQFAINSLLFMDSSTLDEQQDNTHKIIKPEPLPVDPKQLDEEELQEEMQRKRRAFLEKKRMRERKHTVETMRKRVEQLQQQYESLCKRVDQKQREASAMAINQDQDVKQEFARIDSIALTSSTTRATPKRVVPQSQPLSPSAKSTTSLHSLACEMNRLQHENAQLRNNLEYHLHFQHMIRTGVSDMALPPTFGAPCRLNDDCLQQDFRFYPYSAQECVEIVRKDFEQNVVRRPDFFDERINKQLPLGWRGFANIEDDSIVRFQMTKVWPGRPGVLCGVFWRFLNNTTERLRVYSMPRRLELLQQVTEDIAIFRRTTVNARTGCTNHSVFMLYCVRVGESHLVGCVPLPLWGSGNGVSQEDLYGKSLLREREKLVLSQWYFIFEPTLVKQGDEQEVHTRAFRWGFYACETPDDSALWANETVDALLRFEHLLLFPVFNKQICC